MSSNYDFAWMLDYAAPPAIKATIERYVKQGHLGRARNDVWAAFSRGTEDFKWCGLLVSERGNLNRTIGHIPISPSRGVYIYSVEQTLHDLKLARQVANDPSIMRLGRVDSLVIDLRPSMTREMPWWVYGLLVHNLSRPYPGVSKNALTPRPFCPVRFYEMAVDVVDRKYPGRRRELPNVTVGVMNDSGENETAWVTPRGVFDWQTETEVCDGK